MAVYYLDGGRWGSIIFIIVSSASSLADKICDNSGREAHDGTLNVLFYH